MASPHDGTNSCAHDSKFEPYSLQRAGAPLTLSIKLHSSACLYQPTYTTMLWFPTSPLPLHPLSKIPLLLFSTYLVQRGFLTPPNPPSDKTATSAYGEKRDVMSSPTTWRLAGVYKACHIHPTCSVLDAYTVSHSDRVLA